MTLYGSSSFRSVFSEDLNRQSASSLLQLLNGRYFRPVIIVDRDPSRFSRRSRFDMPASGDPLDPPSHTMAARVGCRRRRRIRNTSLGTRSNGRGAFDETASALVPYPPRTFRPDRSDAYTVGRIVGWCEVGGRLPSKCAPSDYSPSSVPAVQYRSLILASSTRLSHVAHALRWLRSLRDQKSRHR